MNNNHFRIRFSRFSQDIKILHFLGEKKPWMQSTNSSTKQVSVPFGYGHLTEYFQAWWNLFWEHVRPSLSLDMVSKKMALLISAVLT